MCKPIPKPSDEDTAKGWTAGYDLVRDISNRVHTEHGWPADMEQVEYTIQVLKEMGYVDINS